MGYRTSMPTISHLIYNLATNQVIQQKLIKEIDETFDDKPKDKKKDKKIKEEENKVKVNEKSDEKKEENKETDGLEEEEGKGFLEAIDGMQYLDACIKETLRLYPPVPIIKRKATTDTKLGNICIPKNSEIWIPVSAVHRDPDYYSNAEVFKPERFLAKSRSKVIEGSYVAFGGDGARGCIAQSVALLEIKLCLISLLKNYRFAKCGLTKELQYESSNEMFASMTPTNVFVKIIKRIKYTEYVSRERGINTYEDRHRLIRPPLPLIHSHIRAAVERAHKTRHDENITADNTLLWGLPVFQA
ncbi:unnamed protein product [Oppiella nova]|uniref:Cytochrome P450 n=1 Tax=Oppiella nova TaxID=334625 RepID=A0A7R9LUV8_9ACAR|nr:unnamed protein product [Oppiella nova]CAG2166870.1 unnamed protein product [Oppiella nova]